MQCKQLALPNNNTQCAFLQMESSTKKDASFQALTNPPPCVATLYTKIYPLVFHTPPACSLIIITINLCIFILSPAT